MQKRLTLAVVAILLLTGCMAQSSGVTADDVEHWQTTADNSLAASDFRIDTLDPGCDPDDCDSFGAVATYPTHTELMADEDQLVALYNLMTSEAGSARITMRAGTDDYEELGYTAAKAVVDAAADDLATAQVLVSSATVSEAGLNRGAVLRLYVTDPSALTPQLLEVALDAASDPQGAQISTIYALTPDGVGFDYGSEGFSDTVITPQEVDAFTDIATNNCVIQGDWAFDISSERIVPYPAHSPGGACA